MRKLHFAKIIQDQLALLESIPTEPPNRRHDATRSMMQTCIKGMWICFTGTFSDAADSYPVTRQRVIDALHGEDPTMNVIIEKRRLEDEAHRTGCESGETCCPSV